MTTRATVPYLKEMFPNVSDSVLLTAFQQNNGDVEAATEALLNMTLDETKVFIRTYVTLLAAFNRCIRLHSFAFV